MISSSIPPLTSVQKQSNQTPSRFSKTNVLAEGRGVGGDEDHLGLAVAQGLHGGAVSELVLTRLDHLNTSDAHDDEYLRVNTCECIWVKNENSPGNPASKKSVRKKRVTKDVSA